MLPYKLLSIRISVVDSVSEKYISSYNLYSWRVRKKLVPFSVWARFLIVTLRKVVLNFRLSLLFFRWKVAERTQTASTTFSKKVYLVYCASHLLCTSAAYVGLAGSVNKSYLPSSVLWYQTFTKRGSCVSLSRSQNLIVVPVRFDWHFTLLWP